MCCVPPGAARLCERYRAGEFLVEVFYDREGRAILSDGRLCPVRPEGLPELAAFDEARSGWTLRSRDLDRFWTERGVLVEETVNPRTDGVRTVRQFDAAGLLQQEAGFTKEDRPHGPFYRRFPDAEPCPYADQTIRQERGTYDAGQTTGLWSFLDADGAVVRTVDRGIAVGDGDQPEARWPCWPMRAAIGWRRRARWRRKGACARHSWRPRAGSRRRAIAPCSIGCAPITSCPSSRNAKRNGARRCRSPRTGTSRRSWTR